MWLVEQDAILTKDNMLKRNWHENPNCYFCNTTESSIHLFFECPVAKATWGIVAISLGHTSHPCSYEQFWRWVTMALPGGDDFYMLGVAAICWATWKCRNRVCFDKKPIKNPDGIIFSACAFMKYWTSLYPEEAQQHRCGSDDEDCTEAPGKRWRLTKAGAARQYLRC
jgi:hypothetical protein